MNTTEPPFDDLRVRRAVNYAIAPAAIRRIFAGQMEPLQQVLPPAMPGHREFVLYPHDIARAKALIAAADPAEREVTVWTNDFPSNLEAGEYFEGVLRELGFEPRLKVLSTSSYFAGASNWSRLVDPKLDRRVQRLRLQHLGPAQEAAYARLDRAYMREAPWAPVGTLEVATFVADRIDLDELVISPIYGQDLASFELSEN